MDWITELLAKIGAGLSTDVLAAGSLGNAIGTGAITGAGIGGLSSALTGNNIGQGMTMGALTGGVGSGITHGLQGLASEDVLARQATNNAAINAKATGTPAPTPEFNQVAQNAGVETNPMMARQSPNMSGGQPSAMPNFNSVAQNAGVQTNPSLAQQSVMSNAAKTTPAPQPSFLNKIGNFAVNNPGITAGVASLGTNMALNAMSSPDDKNAQPAPYNGPLSKFQWAGGPTPTYDPLKFKRQSPYLYAAGGITDLDSYTSQAQNTPTSGVTQIPNVADVADPEGYGQESMRMMAIGGIADLGSYAAGGKPNLLHGAGDGVSDDIPATIAGKQPARLAAGEYVVPSRIVSELGNGSTDAGAARLDEMVKRIQAGRAKTLGSKKQFANDTRAYKHLPV